MKCIYGHYEHSKFIPKKITNATNIFQKCTGIQSTVQAEIIEIDILYPTYLKKCWELIPISLIFL